MSLATTRLTAFQAAQEALGPLTLFPRAAKNDLAENFGIRGPLGPCARGGGGGVVTVANHIYKDTKNHFLISRLATLATLRRKA